MISIEEAYQRVINNTELASEELISVSESLHRRLTRTLEAPIHLPLFDNSAVDGYALGPNVNPAGATFEIAYEVPAGDTQKRTLNPGEVARIFTGAPIPENTASVVMQEFTQNDGNTVSFAENTPFKEGNHIRRKGKEVEMGKELFDRGWHINPATIGFLSSLGIDQVPCYTEPQITILSTGNELVEPGKEVKHGEIYESNCRMLIGALNQLGIRRIEAQKLGDDLEQTLKTLKAALNQSDYVIISGGISVGKYDFVKTANEQLGVESLFYKVRQKPGKPLFFGKKESCLVFALPGNPAAALTCFYRYLKPSLEKHGGSKNFDPSFLKLPLQQDFFKKGDRAVMLKASIQNGSVSLLDGQSSAMLYSFAEANALVQLPTEEKQYHTGDEVLVIPL
ncbi:molybdopterin molybdotransferase MoeA [bacterium SCSIO 12741]|nr:molybdopterin molybdotransferase MoeA [bacterium SCSIO 12741]